MLKNSRMSELNFEQRRLLLIIGDGLVYYAKHGEVHSAAICLVTGHCYTKSKIYPMDVMWCILAILESLPEGNPKVIRLPNARIAIHLIMERLADYPEALQSFENLLTTLDQRVESLDSEPDEADEPCDDGNGEPCDDGNGEPCDDGN